ncbi:MAG: hypothetical protein PVF17_04240 [Ignavibacteria bacterium]|jgi:hypothetical protein
MYQNIALSPLFFDGLKDLTDSDYSKLLINLLTEKILCDEEKIMLQEYDKKLIDLDMAGQIGPLKKAIIQTLTFNGIVKFKSNKHLNKRKEFYYKDYESEKKLLTDDEWRVIVSHNISDELKLKLKLESDIEIAGVNEYSKPPNDSRIRAEETIKKEPGQRFNFRNWICKYIKDAQKIIVKDGYICTRSALPDFRFILSNISKNNPIKIFTLSDEARLKSRDPKNPKSDGIEVKKILEELKKKFSFSNFTYKTINDKKLLTERSIDTDLWHINLGHAIGSVKGETVNRQFEISVHRIQ